MIIIIFEDDIPATKTTFSPDSTQNGFLLKLYYKTTEVTAQQFMIFVKVLDVYDHTSAIEQ